MIRFVFALIAFCDRFLWKLLFVSDDLLDISEEDIGIVLQNWQFLLICGIFYEHFKNLVLLFLSCVFKSLFRKHLENKPIQK